MLTQLASRILRATAAALASTLLISATANAQNITGAGATFPAPIYSTWGEDYAKAGGDRLNYQALGSGAGVTQIINRTVDFGASDSPRRQGKAGEGKAPAIPGGDWRSRAGRERARRRWHEDQAHRRSPRRDLCRPRAPVERSEDRRPQPHAETAADPDLARLSRGLVGHDQHLHEIPLRRLAPSSRSAPARATPSRGAPALARRAMPASPLR